MVYGNLHRLFRLGYDSNVFGMGLFSDGGIFATKPYLCGSNYLLKMSNYKKGEWSSIVDGLYWSFIYRHKDYFKTNHRLSMMYHSVIKMDRVSSSPWMCKIGGEFYKGRYMFTVDYTDSYISDDPAQHKQSHVLQLIDSGKWTGNIVALPNNRVRATSPALWETGEGAPDFKPSQWIHNAECDNSYMDPSVTFDNLYKD